MLEVPAPLDLLAGVVEPLPFPDPVVVPTLVLPCPLLVEVPVVVPPDGLVVLVGGVVLEFELGFVTLVIGCGAGVPPAGVLAPHPLKAVASISTIPAPTFCCICFIAITPFVQDMGWTQESKEPYGMKSALRIVYAVCTGTAFGTMLFFLTVVAQTIFAALPIETAGPVVSRLFPPYYTLTTILCGLGLLASFGLRASYRSRWFTTAQVLLAISTVSLLVSWLILLPKMNAVAAQIHTFAGPATPLTTEFFMYHGISMLLSGVAMLCTGLSLVGWAAVRTSSKEAFS